MNEKDMVMYFDEEINNVLDKMNNGTEKRSSSQFKAKESAL